MSKNIAMYLMNQKGYYVLDKYLKHFGPSKMEAVISSPDPGMDKDFFSEIRDLCRIYDIKFYCRNEKPDLKAKYLFAIGWRWLIKDCDNLIIFHDSLLPKYRGFAPLVSSLINKEEYIGVTALFASSEYDEGDIIAQEAVKIKYPIKIAVAIEKIQEIYFSLVKKIAENILSAQKLARQPQNKSEATYSLWRDERDYQIDWNKDAEYIKRFIDAVGYPYKRASCSLNSAGVRIIDSIVVPDIKIENRVPGKVVFVQEGLPVVVCGKGLLKILAAINEATGESVLPLTKFRTRFE